MLNKSSLLKSRLSERARYNSRLSKSKPYKFQLSKSLAHKSLLSKIPPYKYLHLQRGGCQRVFRHSFSLVCNLSNCAIMDIGEVTRPKVRNVLKKNCKLELISKATQRCQSWSCDDVTKWMVNNGLVHYAAR